MSIDFKMAWRNVWRNKRRTFLTIGAIAFASLLLVFMLSFQFGTYEAFINAAVKISTGHIQVQAKDYLDKTDIRLTVDDPEAVGKILDETEGVRAFTYRAEGFSLVSSKERTYGVLVVGIDPEREQKVSTLKSLIREGEFLAPGDTEEALVGKLLADNLQVGLGDELTVLGQGRDGSVAATVVKVKGIFSSGQDDFDRSSIQIPLKTFQDVYTMDGSVHKVVAIADSLGDVDKIKAEIRPRLKGLNPDRRPLVVLDWKEIMPGLLQSIKIDLISGLIFYVILIIVVAFSIMNTFLMAIFERTREFGIMMAVGTAPGRLVKLLLIESTAMTMLGIVAGIIGGILVTSYFQVHGIDIGGSSEFLRQYGISGKLYPQLSLLSATIGPGLVLIITLIAALYPAFRVRSLKPVEAISHI